jgi:hypothetical protein
MPHRHRLRTVGRPLAALSALLALTGCQAPGPRVTVVQGTRTVQVEVACAARGDAPLDPATCQRARAPRLTVAAGDTLGVGVEPKVAENGWYLAFGPGQQIGPFKRTFLQVPMPLQLPEQLGELQVIEAPGNRPTRAWLFALDTRP